MDVFGVWTPLTQAHRVGSVRVRSERHGGLSSKGWGVVKVRDGAFEGGLRQRVAL